MLAYRLHERRQSFREKLENIQIVVGLNVLIRCLDLVQLAVMSQCKFLRRVVMCALHCFGKIPDSEWRMVGWGEAGSRWFG